MKAATGKQQRELSYLEEQRLDEARAAAAIFQGALLNLLGVPGNAFGPRIADLMKQAEHLIRTSEE